MAFIVADRVKEVTTTTGSGAYTLGGAADGFQTFAAVTSDGDTVYYAITNDTYWEVGIGTLSNSQATLSRTTLLSSSSGGGAVNWGAGTKNIFLTLPAEKAILEDASNNAVIGASLTVGANITVGGTVDGVDIAARNSVLTSTTNTANAALPKAGGTMSGGLAMGGSKITGAGNPTAAQDLTTKTYVDGIAAAGVVYHSPVRLASTANLSAAYANGSSGVGATLTNNSTQAALVLDGLAAVNGNRVLIDEQSNAAHNGAYTVTTIGSGSANWVLTRATDADSFENVGSTGLGQGSAFFVSEGNTEAGHLRVCSTTGTIVFGTTNIVFALAADTTVYSAGTGLSLTGTTFAAVQDIATSATPVFAGGTFNGDVTFDGATAGRDVVFDRSANALEFADNAKATFGTGDDASIFFDATDFQVNAGAGDLNLSVSAAGSSVKILGSGEALAEFTDDGDVDLFHNGTLKFSTTAAGVNIPGNITVTGTVDGVDIATRDGVLTTTTNTANAALPKAGGSMSGAITTASNAALELDPNGSGKVTFKGNGTKGAGQFVLNCEVNSHGIVIKGPPHSANANYTLTLPNNDGNANQFLQTNGSGVTSWAAALTSIQANSVALGNDTTGNYVAAGATSGTGLSGSVSSEGGTFTVTSNATNSNNGSTIVARDGSGNFSAGTVTAALTGNASTASTLATSRTIGGVAFNGSANINLPGVNASGNQNTSGNASTSSSCSGNAATATTLVNARNIGGVSFNGSASINLPGVNTAGNQNTSGTATTATTANALNTSNDYRVDSFGVGTNASGTTGEIRATNNVTAYYSDDRLKTRFGNIKNALEMISTLNGFYYEANATAEALGYEVHRELGVSAQEVQAIMPEIVAPAPIDDKYLTVRYERMAPLFIEAIKELKSKVESLEAQLLEK